LEKKVMAQSSTSYAQASASFARAGSPAYAAGGSKSLQLVSKAIAWFGEQRRIRRTIATLSDLNDATLRDIGIERGDIERVARHGR
jgi:uncharacterized protein YjiS (DUF1127 family)